MPLREPSSTPGAEPNAPLLHPATHLLRSQGAVLGESLAVAANCQRFERRQAEGGKTIHVKKRRTTLSAPATQGRPAFGRGAQLLVMRTRYAHDVLHANHKKLVHAEHLGGR